MLNFKVYYNQGDYHGISKVFAIDTGRGRFLICTPSGEFIWIDTDYCTLEEDDNNGTC